MSFPKKQLDALDRNCAEFGVTLYDRFSPLQGIVHVIGPDLGYTQPGKTVVCGEAIPLLTVPSAPLPSVSVLQRLSTCWPPRLCVFLKPDTMEIRVKGQLPTGVTEKDIFLAIIGKFGGFTGRRTRN
ncbi:MAG: hypothetical protein Ct9H300mP11_17930 [Chloroflexota bacterium]|nr:MAG: hypothetical protein Ct9H300mP11_17930 [Chloroflexota bacterium]